MNVLIVEPGKMPYEKDIPSGLASLQAIVGGLIEPYYPFAYDPVAIICNEEGKINGMDLNRAIYNEDGKMVEIMAGPFIMAGIGEQDFTDLPPGMMEKYKEKFKHPEAFRRLAGQIVVIKQPIPQQDKDAAEQGQPPKGGPEL